MRSLGQTTLMLLLTMLPLTSCATVLGTAVSPITGGVDLARLATRPSQWYLVPVYFVGGAISGPFVAFYNGMSYDPGVFKDFSGYWNEFDSVFRPFEKIR